MSSLFEDLYVEIRDDGQEEQKAVAPKLDEDGDLLTDPETGEPVQAGKPYQPARKPWPKGEAILIPQVIEVGAYRKAQKLNEKYEADEDLQPYAPLVYAATFVRGFKSPAKGWFRDPKTSEVMEMPDSFDTRIRLLNKLPIPMLMFLNAKITEQALGPLPGLS